MNGYQLSGPWQQWLFVLFCASRSRPLPHFSSLYVDTQSLFTVTWTIAMQYFWWCNSHQYCSEKLTKIVLTINWLDRQPFFLHFFCCCRHLLGLECLTENQFQLKRMNEVVIFALVFLFQVCSVVVVCSWGSMSMSNFSQTKNIHQTTDINYIYDILNDNKQQKILYKGTNVKKHVWFHFGKTGTLPSL